MLHPIPVRTAIAGLSHDHVIWLLRNLKRTPSVMNAVRIRPGA